MRSVFQSLSDGQIKCILLTDEVCVRPMLLYHGGQLIHHSVRYNTQLVRSFVLVFMIVCLYGGPKLLVKTLTITRLDTNFLYDQSKMLIDQIKDCGGNLAAVIICDNNCVNPVFFKRIPCISLWRTEDNVFLLFDFIHIDKSIWNNWNSTKQSN